MIKPLELKQIIEEARQDLRYFRRQEGKSARLQDVLEEILKKHGIKIDSEGTKHEIYSRVGKALSLGNKRPGKHATKMIFNAVDRPLPKIRLKLPKDPQRDLFPHCPFPD